MITRLHTLQLAEPFRIAHGTSSERIVLRMAEGEGIAEAPFVPYYGDDPAETLALVEAGTSPASLPRTARLAWNLLEHDLAAREASPSLGLGP